MPETPFARSRGPGIALQFVAIALACVAGGCGASRGPAPQSPSLVGSWNVADTSGGTIQFGFRIQDDRGGDITGVMERVFSGNVGIDVSGFQAMRGTVAGSRVTLRAPHREEAMSIRFAFTIVDDGLHVISIEWANESLVGVPNTWVARRG